MMWTIAGKELRRLFASPLAWVILAFLQLILALDLPARLQTFFDLQPQIAMIPSAPGLTEIVVAPTFGTARIVLLMVVPLLSMRLISEERRNQTLPFLMSAPVSITQIVLGKFVGLLAFLGIARHIAAADGAVALPGRQARYRTAGRQCAGLVAAVRLLRCGRVVFLIAHRTSAGSGDRNVRRLARSVARSISRPATPTAPLHLLSLIKHYDTFSSGIVALNDLAYYLIVIALFLLLSVRRLDGDRLRT